MSLLLPRPAPKAWSTQGLALPAMAMKEAAPEDNLMRAFEKVAQNAMVAQNDGAPWTGLAQRGRGARAP